MPLIKIDAITGQGPFGSKSLTLSHFGGMSVHHYILVIIQIQGDNRIVVIQAHLPSQRIIYILFFYFTQSIELCLLRMKEYVPKVTLSYQAGREPTNGG